MSLADSLGRSASVTTLEESTFLAMDRATFRACVEEAPKLAWPDTTLSDWAVHTVQHYTPMQRVQATIRIY